MADFQLRRTALRSREKTSSFFHSFLITSMSKTTSKTTAQYVLGLKTFPPHPIQFLVLQDQDIN
jgi:hypothetical protein